jgi:hypothetical protein
MLRPRECSLYASSRLTGPAADWWDSYVAAHATADTITWVEFTTHCRNYQIPAGLMKCDTPIFLKEVKLIFLFSLMFCGIGV